MPKNLGMILLAVWLILFGLLTTSFLNISFARSHDVLAVLAIAVGVVLLVQR
jgi:cell division protein FtsW (lipid II flippase)